MPPSPSEARFTAWSAALDELQANVDHIQAWIQTFDAATDDDFDTLAMHAMSWSVPPDLPGQIPVALVPRAQAIAMRQSAVRAELTARMEGVRTQLRVIRRVEVATVAPATPAYLDLRA